MKRSIAMLLALALVLPCCLGIAAAAGSEITPRASLTITATSAASYTGDNKGEVDFDYSIMPTGTADELGVSSIVIHCPDGSKVKIFGTTSNGLIGSGIIHAGTYTYKGIAGQPYYADITLFATIGSNTDSRTITTKSANAHP